ncbi:MAG TPA: vWA domain-containing protein [Gaiellaceae bacterium]|jgi:hypothetical protein|nr:vWA domain-containing protein [Gaiellaceae bacterium]
MTLTFLTPLGAVLILGLIVPLVALLFVRRRARHVRSALGVSEPPFRRLAVVLLALVLAGTLVGFAAAQPVVEQTKSRRVRTDAEVFFVVDVSRSMLAQSGPGAPQRFDRARVAASKLRASLPDVPVGVASMTDRVLPHLFPSADEDVFEATLNRSLGIERPPPSSGVATQATNLSSLATIRGLHFFSPGPDTKRRLVVVFTDGESTPVSNARLGTLYRQPPTIASIFVHVWNRDERVYTRGASEPQYRPDPSSRAILERLAKSTGGSVFAEGDLGAATRQARKLLGEGPTVVRGQSGNRTALAPFLAAAALLPLTLVLRRRDR